MFRAIPRICDGHGGGEICQTLSDGHFALYRQQAYAFAGGLDSFFLKAMAGWKSTNYPCY